MSHEKLYEEATKVAAQSENDGSDGVSSAQATNEFKAGVANGAASFEDMMAARSDRFGTENDELTYAFYGLASLINSSLLSGVTFNAESLADEYERLALQAGSELAREKGGSTSPNRHLQLLAATTRQSARLRGSAVAVGGVADQHAHSSGETLRADSAPT